MGGGTFGTIPTFGTTPLTGGATPPGLTPVDEFTLGTKVLTPGADPTGAFTEGMVLTDGMVLGTTPLTGPVAWLTEGVVTDPVLFKFWVPFIVGLLRVPLVPAPFIVPLLFKALLPLMVPLAPDPLGFGSPGCWTPSCA